MMRANLPPGVTVVAVLQLWRRRTQGQCFSDDAKEAVEFLTLALSQKIATFAAPTTSLVLSPRQASSRGGSPQNRCVSVCVHACLHVSV